MSTLRDRVLVASGVVGMALVLGQGMTARGGGLPAALAKQEAPVAGGLRGVWTAERSKWRVENGGTATLVELSLRRVGGRGQWNSSETLPLPELRGLTTAMLEAPSADARFAWTRDAGTFDCQGRFETGVGAGHFSFTANAEYASDMKRRGYGEIDVEKALRLALHDVSRSFIDELGRLGYERMPIDGLISLRIHGVSPEFIRAFKALGYAALTPDQLVSMRIHGVSPEFVKELAGLGYKGIEVSDLVSMRIHGVTTDFVRRVQGRSGKDVTVDRLVSMRIHGQSE
jgi:hypothetical protein